jgi:hypothetical protein
MFWVLSLAYDSARIPANPAILSIEEPGERLETLRLRPDQEIAGCPATQVRTLLRRFNQEFWTVKEAAKVLKTSEAHARRLAYSLGRLGYVEVVR